MTEIQKIRKIAAYKANETRKLAKLSPYAYKARKAIKEEFAAKIAEVERDNMKTMHVSCGSKKSCNCKIKNVKVYEVYTRNHGRFVFLGKTTKNPLK